MRVVLLLTLTFWMTACAAPAERVSPRPSVKEALVKQGYRPSMLDGQLLYCRDESVTGTQFQSRVCLNDEQIRQQEQRTRATLDGRAMHPNLQCHNQECSP